MRRRMLATLLLLGALAGPGAARDGEGVDRATVRERLAAADPLAEGSASELLTWDEATDRALIDIIRDEETRPIVLDRALRLTIAWNRVDRVHEALHVEAHAPIWWLALDELDRELPSGPREILLAQAIPDEAQRTEALARLAKGRAVAKRFCLEWNEIIRNEDERARHAALRKELEAAGPTAVPYLASVLVVPPDATFVQIHPERGLTARQQVRALFALDFLDARSVVSLVMFHSSGPSFTQSTTAQSILVRWADLKVPAEGGEDARVKAIEAWYRTGWGGSWEREYVVRHVLGWARRGIESDDPERQEFASSAPHWLERVTGDLEFDDGEPLEARRERLAELEREALLRCPACIR